MGDGTIDLRAEHAVVKDMTAEITRLREALRPFALESLTRAAKDASDNEPVTVTMGMCRRAQRAMSVD